MALVVRRPTGREEADIAKGENIVRIIYKEIPLGKKRRGKRTIAKEQLYKYISRKTREIRPGFNVGTNTGIVSKEDYWLHSYRHWKFRPNDHEINKDLFKITKAPFSLHKFPEWHSSVREL